MKPGEVQLWRIANTSGRSGAFFLGPPPGFTWKQIAQDGVQFADANYQSSTNKSFTMAAGNRVDLLVKAPPTPAAIYPVVVQHAVDPSDLKSAYPVPLVSVRIKAGEQPVTGKPSQFISPAPTPPAFLADIADAEVQGTRTIDFASTPPFPAQHTINGKKFDGFENRSEGISQYRGGMEDHECDGKSQHLASIPHPHQPVPDRGVVRSERRLSRIPTRQGQPPTLPKYIFYLAKQLAPGQCYVDPKEIDPKDQKIWTYTNPNDKATWTAVSAAAGNAGAARLVGRVPDSVRPRRDGSERKAQRPSRSGREANQAHSCRILQDAQPLRRLPRLLRAPLPHPGARGPRHDDDRACVTAQGRARAASVQASLGREHGTILARCAAT